MTKILSLQIDGQRIYATPQATILEAAQANGIAIPTLCYHPRLSALGHCRVCLVEVEGFKRPVTACDNPVAEGMVVNTTGSSLEKMRSRMIELALATHPYKDCLTCVRTGSCELQEKAYHCQVELPAQLERRMAGRDLNQKLDLVRDEEKCILCGRCIEICRTGPGRFVYSMIGRGVNTRVVPWRDGREVTLEEAGCIFCGQCIDVCPVAALTERSRFTGGREWELTAKPGVCLGCSLGCRLERRVDAQRLINNTVPRDGDRVGWLCVKGKFEDVAAAAAQTTVSRKKGSDGIFEPVDYESAVNAAAAGLAKISKDNHGQQSFAILGDGTVSCEEAYLLHKLAHSVLATANIDLGLEPAWVATYCQAGQVSGFGLPGPTMANLSEADTVMVIGSGLAESHPVAEMVLRRAGRYSDMNLIGIDRKGEDFKAWQNLNLSDETGATLELLQDIRAAIEGGDQVNLDLKSKIDPLLAKRVANLMLQANSYMIVCPTFFCDADHDLVDALIELAKAAGLLSGGRQRLLLLSAYQNAAGILTFGGSPLYGPGLKPLNGEAGMNRAQMTRALQGGQLKGLVYFGKAAAPDLDGASYAVAALSGNPDTSLSFDLIFSTPPAAVQEGLYINASNQVCLNERSFDPGPGVSEGWRLICDLARSLGAKWRYSSLEDIREEMRRLMPCG